MLGDLRSRQKHLGWLDSETLGKRPRAFGDQRLKRMVGTLGGIVRIRRFPKIRGTFLGVPIIRNIVFWGLYWGPLILGNYHTFQPCIGYSVSAVILFGWFLSLCPCNDSACRHLLYSPQMCMRQMPSERLFIIESRALVHMQLRYVQIKSRRKGLLD